MRRYYMRQLVKWYLKSLTKDQRDTRLVFVGRRLAIKKYRWLHFNYHPWEITKDKEDVQE